MDSILEGKLKDAVWVAKSLFDRQKVSGSSANMSFRHGDLVYISGSGTCFGSLTEDSFACVEMASEKHMSGPKPSKEMPLHLQLYRKTEKVQAVIHTHSFFSTLWSCLPHENERDVMPNYTPYLKMKLGTVGLIPYAPPGSKELFSLFGERVNNSDGYLLANHGPVVGGADILSAFYILEELEESAKIAWFLRSEKDVPFISSAR